MCQSPNSDILRRAIDLNYANRQRASSLKWICVNASLFFVFAYDLWCKCPGYTSSLHVAELVAATILAANCIQHAFKLLPRRSKSIPLTTTQRTLLGLDHANLDSSFHIKDDDGPSADISKNMTENEDDTLPASLSPPRTWHASRRTDSPHSPHSPQSSHSPHSPHSPHGFHTSQSPHTPHSPHSPNSSLIQSPYASQSLHSSYERLFESEYISDQNSLDKYLKQIEARDGEEFDLSIGEGNTSGRSINVSWPYTRLHQPVYQLSVLPPTLGKDGDTSGTGEDDASSTGAGVGAHVYRRLQLDPQRVTEYKLNLRRWIHMTVIGRVAREIDEVEVALRSAGLGGVSAGARWEALAAAAPAPLAHRLRALTPFVQPFADQLYVTKRIRELARGGCLSAYRWDSGGTDWEPGTARPPDAELVLRLLAAYLDCVTPAPGFSASHLAGVGGRPRPAASLYIQRVTARPPHYVVVAGDDALDPGAGRDNLFHTILLFIAAAARQDPPAIARTHLGPAGLNLLWVLGR